MARLEFPRKIRRAIIERANGKCEKCSAALKPGEGEADHILPCELGGKPEASNGMWLCKVCHSAKTATDVRRIRKADRQRDKASRAVKPKQSIRSAPFPKAAKPAQKPTLPPRRMFVEERT